MALKQIIKFTKRVQEFSNKAKNTGDAAIYGQLVDGFSISLKTRLQDGIDNGYNIDGKKFRKADPTPTNPTTIALRDSKLKPRQSSNTPILHGTGALRNSFTISHRGRLGDGELFLSKDSIYDKYGKYHNSGFTQGEGQWFAGSSVPQRKYWGIPNSWRSPNGSTYKKIMAKFASDMNFQFKTFLDRGILPDLTKSFEEHVLKNIDLYR